MRYRPADLPVERRDPRALLALAELAEGRAHPPLFAMRVVALEAMRALAPFEPRLIGSVGPATSAAGATSTSRSSPPPRRARGAPPRAPLGVRARARERSRSSARSASTCTSVAGRFPIELTVYAPRELRFRPRSSTDGKPIVRLTPNALRAVLARDREESWSRYLETGETPSWEEPPDSLDDDDCGS